MRRPSARPTYEERMAYYGTRPPHPSRSLRWGIKRRIESVGSFDPVTFDAVLTLECGHEVARAGSLCGLNRRMYCYCTKCAEEG